MLQRAIALEALYDAAGRHLGGVYSPLMVDGALTAEHAGCLSTRPVQLLIYQVGVCLDSPTSHLAFVWMMPTLPDGSHPFGHSPAVLPYLVHALDAGYSVMLHAARLADIEAVKVGVMLWIGGGRA